MEPSEKTTEVAPSPSQERSAGWWLLFLIFVLIPIRWGPWWLTVASLTICAALALVTFRATRIGTGFGFSLCG
ncbi:MAG: hypothetical protein JWN63_715 [Candidatus Acidoferrum typicum]|nr:hypothetical protein [Candidatus Acidoferrum typicum]